MSTVIVQSFLNQRSDEESSAFEISYFNVYIYFQVRLSAKLLDFRYAAFLSLKMFELFENLDILGRGY